MIQKYNLEFILYALNGTAASVKNALTEFGEGLEVSACDEDPDKSRNFAVKIRTEDPTVIFDICSQIGRIKSVRVNEI